MNCIFFLRTEQHLLWRSIFIYYFYLLLLLVFLAVCVFLSSSSLHWHFRQYAAHGTQLFELHLNLLASSSFHLPRTHTHTHILFVCIILFLFFFFSLLSSIYDYNNTEIDHVPRQTSLLSRPDRFPQCELFVNPVYLVRMKSKKCVLVCIFRFLLVSWSGL